MFIVFCLHTKLLIPEIKIWLISAIQISTHNLQHAFKDKLTEEDHGELLSNQTYLCHECISKIMCKQFMKKLVKTALKHKHYIYMQTVNVFEKFLWYLPAQRLMLRQKHGIKMLTLLTMTCFEWNCLYIRKVDEAMNYLSKHITKRNNDGALTIINYISSTQFLIYIIGSLKYSKIWTKNESKQMFQKTIRNKCNLRHFFKNHWYKPMILNEPKARPIPLVMELENQYKMKHHTGNVHDICLEIMEYKILNQRIDGGNDEIVLYTYFSLCVENDYSFIDLPDFNAADYEKCNYCKKSNKNRLKWCAGCRLTMYCSKKCQKKVHRNECKQMRKSWRS